MSCNFCPWLETNCISKMRAIVKVKRGDVSCFQVGGSRNLIFYSVHLYQLGGMTITSGSKGYLVVLFFLCCSYFPYFMDDEKPVRLPGHHLPVLPWQDRVDCQASRRDKGLRSRCTVCSQPHRGQVVMQRCCRILTQLEAPVSSGHYLETSSNFRMHANGLPEARRAFHQCHEGSFIPRLHMPSCHLQERN